MNISTKLLYTKMIRNEKLSKLTHVRFKVNLNEPNAYKHFETALLELINIEGLKDK